MQQQPVRRFPLGGDLYAYVSPSEHKVELRIGRIQMATDRKGGWTEMEGSDVRLDLKKWRRLVAMERKLTEEFERHQVAWQNFQRGRKRASLQERRDNKKLRLENDDDGGVVLQQQKQTNNDYPRAFLNVGALTPKSPPPAKEEDDDPAAATKEKEEEEDDDVAADKEEEEEEEAPAAAAAAVAAAAAAAVKEEEHSCCCT